MTWRVRSWTQSDTTDSAGNSARTERLNADIAAVTGRPGTSSRSNAGTRHLSALAKFDRGADEERHDHARYDREDGCRYGGTGAAASGVSDKRRDRGYDRNAAVDQEDNPQRPSVLL